MNYIFLDIDGVLNSNSFIRKNVDEDTILDENNIKLLAKLVEKTNAKIILSSSWRIYFTEDGKPKENSFTQRGANLEKIFKKYNIEIISRTRVGIGKYGNSYDEGNRYEEIFDYINENLGSNDNFIVLDDEDFNGKLNIFGEKFIQINFYTGLQDDEVKKGIKILNRERTDK